MLRVGEMVFLVEATLTNYLIPNVQTINKNPEKKDIGFQPED